MTKAYRSKIISFVEAMQRSSWMKIPAYFIEYDKQSPVTRTHIFLLRMPITDAWEPLIVSDKHLQACCIPMEVQKKLDYWVASQKMLEHARDWRPMNGDLQPITGEEKSIFGVRSSRDNPCFPVKLTRPGSYIGEFDYIYKSRGLD